MNIYNAACVIHVGKKMGKEYKLFENEKFDRLTDSSFKLILYSAFKKKDQVLAEPLFRALHDISAKHGFNNFEYHLRISGEPKWDTNFFKKTLDLQASKVIIYGPLGAEESLKSILDSIGIKESQYHRI
jgi:hypothetical protein